jgi:carbonic anhydrase/acetyltransferase-like protein (isoleucine patch superfamily)
MPIYALGKVEPSLPDVGQFWLAPDAQVIGNVRLAPDVGIWFGAILRGDTELLVVGEGSNIQEGAMLHADPGFPVTIGRGVTVGHHAILHGCVIGANTLIGMGSTILNGARVGANCLVGANALITEGKGISGQLSHHRRAGKGPACSGPKR